VLPKSLLQRYILNPLLLDGRKSEIRTYWLLASVDPLLVLYHDGTVRLNTAQFSHSDWDNALIHITNTFQQKQVLKEQYAEVSDTLKWELNRLGEYLFTQNMTTDPLFVENSLKPMLKRVIVRAVNATRATWTAENGARKASFELLGMDAMVAGDLSRVWMTEIQRGPGLSRDNPVKMKVIPAMLAELITIEMEIDRLRQQNIRPNRHLLSTVKQFEWIIDEGDSPPFYFQ